MRRTITELCLLVFAIAAIHLTSFLRSGHIAGKIYPITKTNHLVAVNGADSVRAYCAQDGNFGLQVRPGTWTLVVDIGEQRRSVVKERLVVAEGENINLGIIRLSE
jgi:hypothetical protein